MRIACYDTSCLKLWMWVFDGEAYDGDPEGDSLRGSPRMVTLQTTPSLAFSVFASLLRPRLLTICTATRHSICNVRFVILLQH